MVYWLAHQTFSQVTLFGTPNAYLPHPLCTSTHTAVWVFITEKFCCTWTVFNKNQQLGKKRPTNKEINRNKIKSFYLDI